jgi:putative ABC transport system permease protein
VAVQAQNKKEGGNGFEMSLPDTRDVMTRSRTLESVASWNQTSAFVTTGGDAQRYLATSATDALPRVLGVQLALGRWFTPQECTFAGRLVPVVLGNRVWKERFGADRGVLGRTLSMNGRVRTVVGVMPENFRFPEQSEIFIPLATDDTTDSRGAHWLDVAARMTHGTTLAQARAELGAIAADNARAYPATNEHMTLIAVPFRDQLGEGPRPALLMLSLAVLFVLLIACANVANLQLARAASRRREIGVRIAMGATRGRLVRQMVTESLMLSLVGGVLGALFGQWAMKLTIASIPEPMPYWMHFRLDPVVVLATLAAAVFAGLAFGVGPALHTTAGDLLTPMREGTPGGGDTRSSRRIRGTLVVAELALSVVLLIGSGLMVRSFLWQLNERHVLTSEGVLTGTVTLPAAIYKDDPARVAFFRELRETLGGLPGVTSVGGVLNLHLGRSRWTMTLGEGIDGDKESTIRMRRSTSSRPVTRHRGHPAPPRSRLHDADVTGRRVSRS